MAPAFLQKNTRSRRKRISLIFYFSMSHGQSLIPDKRKKPFPAREATPGLVVYLSIQVFLLSTILVKYFPPLIMIFCNASEKYSIRLIPVFLIFKKPKHRQEKQKLKPLWKGFAQGQWR